MTRLLSDPVDGPTPGEPRTPVARALNSALAVRLASHLPVPLVLARPFLLHDNRQENRLDSWGRLRSSAEAGRYRAVRTMSEKHAADGFVLDVGCSQGLLREGLTCARYVGIDSFADAIAQAGAGHRQSGNPDHPTSFQHADADSFHPDQPPNVVVFNEVLYYLPRPLNTVERYARLLAPGGVVIVSLYQHSWATRRMLRHLTSAFGTQDHVVVRGSTHHAWTVTALRSGSCPGG